MRLRPLLILPAALVVAGCGSQPGPTPGGEPTAAQKTARIELVKANPDLNELELAHLCPAMYPAELFKGTEAQQKKARDKYQMGRLKAEATFTAADLKQAAAAGCGKPVPIAKPATKPAPAPDSKTAPK
ncbi:MAG: hypothetical protein WCO96_10470 [Actinomycetes bacterium]